MLREHSSQIDAIGTATRATTLLVSGYVPDSTHFYIHIQQYDNCLQMTSFGATNVIQENCMPTFKNQGQIYHHLYS